MINKNYNYYFYNNLFKYNNIVKPKLNNKYKISLYNISNMYHNKLYKHFKRVYGFIYTFYYISFNVFKIRLLIFNKKNKEYVIIIKYLNLNNTIKLFFK